MKEEEFIGIEKHACPGVGACAGMYTANTMSSVIEVMGLSLPGSSTMAAEDQEKAESTAKSAAALVRAIEKQILPHQLITRKSLENAVAVVMALGDRKSTRLNSSHL